LTCWDGLRNFRGRRPRGSTRCVTGIPLGRTAHRAARVIGTGGLLVIAALVSAPAHAEVAFCNNFPQPVFIAIAYQQPDGSWTSQGWLRVNVGTCRSFDSARHLSSFYWRAETDWYRDTSGKQVWSAWGEDRNFAVGDYPFGTFTFAHADQSTNTGRVEAFRRFSGPATATLTFHANGGVMTTTQAEAPGAPFSVDAVRVQLSDQKDAPAVTTARQGQTIWIRVVARVNTKVANPVACVAVVPQSTGKESSPDCNNEMRGTFAERGATLGWNFPLRINLREKQNRDVMDITGWVTANGLTQRGRASVEIYR